MGKKPLATDVEDGSQLQRISWTKDFSTDHDGVPSKFVLAIQRWALTVTVMLATPLSIKLIMRKTMLGFLLPQIGVISLYTIQ